MSPSMLVGLEGQPRLRQPPTAAGKLNMPLLLAPLLCWLSWFAVMGLLLLQLLSVPLQPLPDKSTCPLPILMQ